MMKLLSLAAVAGAASAATNAADAAGAGGRRRPRESAAGDDSESSSSAGGRFVGGKPRRRTSDERAGRGRDGDASSSGKRTAARELRSSSLRRGRGGGKGGKQGSSDGSPDYMNHGPDFHSPDYMNRGPGWHSPDHHSPDRHSPDHYMRGEWHGGGSGKSGKGEWGGGGDDWGGGGSGKSGKGQWGGGGTGKDWSDDGWGHEELFYLLPTACPHECITSHVTGARSEFIDAIKQCKEHDESHMWLVRSDGSYIQIESHYDQGMCISVDYERGDGEVMLAKTCYNGELVLKDCDAEYGAEWYFTGGQLVNSLCWGAGLSSLMTVFLEGKDNEEVKECKKDVAVWGANDEAVLKADTFMFVNRLPEAPFRIGDVNDAIKEKIKDNNKSGGIHLNAEDVPIDGEGAT